MFVPPTISDDDIKWVCGIMGLPPHAFSGTDGKDPRANVLKRMDTIDVEACPGSGKTTLLVAKLAILARHWPTMRSGVCVLSHTNAARDEIAGRLSSCAEGAMLMGYPHFVGTIHGFINEFLALPYLRSQGNPIKLIDSDAVIERRWQSLKYKTRLYLNSQNNDDGRAFLRYDTDDFTGQKMRARFASHTETFKLIQTTCKASFAQGLFCYDELFVWARKVIHERPDIVADLRQRFPLVFIDEVQDNDEDQSSLLSRVFMEGDDPSVRQRFGDSNQAIFRSSGVASGATTDGFPGKGIVKIDLPNSFRFGSVIAGIANPFGVAPQGLVGLGPKHRPPAILLFDDTTVKNVLPEYAKYLVEQFNPAELQAGRFTAIAGVHKKGEDDVVPRWLGHYAPDYKPEISSREPRPDYFSQYLMAGWSDAERQKHSAPLANAVASGMLELLRRNGHDAIPVRPKSPHLAVLALTDDEQALRKYRTLLEILIRTAGKVTPTMWNTKLAAAITSIAGMLGGSPVKSAEADDFMTWTAPPAGTMANASIAHVSNVYKYPAFAPKVSVKLGSIHSVKGETHTATLVMETFYHKHYLKMLLPWLLGDSCGGTKQGVQKLKALRLHYVAMTRPSELLCLAMREDALATGDVAKLEKRGWVIKRCSVPVVSSSEGI